MTLTRHKIASRVSVALLIGAVTVTIAVSFKTLQQIEEAAALRYTSFITIGKAQVLFSAIQEAEIGVRGYLLTNNETFLQPYLAVRDSIPEYIKNLHERTESPVAREHLNRVNLLAQDHLTDLALYIALNRTHGTTESATQIRLQSGKQRIGLLRTELQEYTQIVQTLLFQKDATFQENMRFLFIMLTIASLGILLLTLSIVFLIYKEMQHELKNAELREATQLFSIREKATEELKQAHATLQLSEEKLSVTLNSIGDAVLVTDIHGCVTLLNPVAEVLTGWTQEEAYGHIVNDVFCIINETSRVPVAIPIQAALDSGTIQGLANHTILIARSGNEYAIDDSCAPIRDAAGQVIGAVLIFRDISERRAIENGLETTRKELEIIKQDADEASEFSQSLINTVREPLLALDQDLRVVAVSRSFYTFFKVNPEETIGQLIYDLGNKQWDIPKLRDLLETILPQKASFDDYEVEHDFATIGRRIMLLNARQIERASGKERVILLAIEDITERKEIEAGLEKTREELAIIKRNADEASELAENLINTVREPLITLDQDLRVLSVSQSFYEVFKVNPEETVGHLIYDLGNKQWDIPKLRELLETVLPQKSSFNDYEVEHDFSTIGRRIMLLNARQIERASGKERVILLAIEDITERKHIADELEVVHAQLERVVQDQKVVITDSKQDSRDLEARLRRGEHMRLLGQLTSGVAHEVRNPLNGILAIMGAMSKELEHDERFVLSLKHMRDQITRLTLLMENLLSLGRPLREENMQILPMVKLIDSALATWLQTILTVKPIVHFIKPENPACSSIQGDGTSITQMVINLLDNAYHHAPAGTEITCSIHEQSNQTILLKVQDSGKGIAEDILPRIFDPFFTTRKGGTGLGLSIVRTIAENHGGSITAYNNAQGTGATFEVLLPTVQELVV